MTTVGRAVRSPSEAGRKNTGRQTDGRTGSLATELLGYRCARSGGERGSPEKFRSDGKNLASPRAETNNEEFASSHRSFFLRLSALLSFRASLRSRRRSAPDGCSLKLSPLFVRRLASVSRSQIALTFDSCRRRQRSVKKSTAAAAAADGVKFENVSQTQTHCWQAPRCVSKHRGGQLVARRWRHRVAHSRGSLMLVFLARLVRVCIINIGMFVLRQHFKRLLCSVSKIREGESLSRRGRLAQASTCAPVEPEEARRGRRKPPIEACSSERESGSVFWMFWSAGAAPAEPP